VLVEVNLTLRTYSQFHWAAMVFSMLVEEEPSGKYGCGAAVEDWA
jgi:hypothetical protein